MRQGSVVGTPTPDIDLQGHRGARGLLPENSIDGFLLALDIGVNTLEMDAVVCSDDQVVVSHEPWFSGLICRTPEGGRITRWRERSHNIYRMSYAEVTAYDCGRYGHPKFPDQERRSACKPLLADVIEASERHAAEIRRPPPWYNIEVKSHPEHDHRFHPPPKQYVRLLHEVLDSRGVTSRTTIQSFDVRALDVARSTKAGARLSLLVDNRRGFDWNVAALGFLPDIYSPRFTRVDRQLIERAHQSGVDVLPWTVNDPGDMRRLLEIGVDGLITDYPDAGREVVAAFLREVGPI